MISYSPKEWFTFIFRIHKTETFKQLIPLMVGVAIYSGIVAQLEINVIVNDSNREITKGIATFYTILGFTLSLLLVFRTNTAYDRWWEGRRLWGELTNSSRSFAAHMNGILNDDDVQERVILTKLISSFAITLQSHLKSEKVDEIYFKEEFNENYLQPYIKRFSNSSHQPLSIYKSLVEYVDYLFTVQKTKTQEIYHFKSEVNKFIEVCGGCERIKSTPIPFSYSVFLKKFIFFYVMLFPVIYCVHMSFFIIPVTVFILYVLASVELIAEEIEDPFNGDPNDLPTYEMAINIKNSACYILLNKSQNK
jgi:putative membrane protein